MQRRPFKCRRQRFDDDHENRMAAERYCHTWKSDNHGWRWICRQGPNLGWFAQ